MSGVVFWALVAIATVASLATAWTVGANSNSPPFAPPIGANAITTMRAAFLIGILAALGAITQGPPPRAGSRPAGRGRVTAPSSTLRDGDTRTSGVSGSEPTTS